MKQFVSDWEDRYGRGYTPWNDSEAWLRLGEVFTKWVPVNERQPQRVLEIGCGLGYDSLMLARLGYCVTGLDISSTAIDSAKNKHGVMENLRWICCDFLSLDNTPKFEVVYDRGCFHHCADEPTRSAMARKIAELLTGRGIWVTLTGSKDSCSYNNEEAGFLHPQLSAAEIITAVEPMFFLRSMQQLMYGSGVGATNFLAFLTILESRNS
jgi:SAM-dependent methyltransferase